MNVSVDQAGMDACTPLYMLHTQAADAILARMPSFPVRWQSTLGLQCAVGGEQYMVRVGACS